EDIEMTARLGAGDGGAGDGPALALLLRSATAASDDEGQRRREGGRSHECAHARPFHEPPRAVRCTRRRVHCVHRPRLGLRASWRPSPRRLKASTVSSSATPGKTMYHQALSKMEVASAIIAPQLAFGGCTPTPRKDRAASNRMFWGMTSVE